MVIFEYDKDNPENLEEIVENIGLLRAGNFDVCLLASSRKDFIFKNGIHIWINSSESENSSLLILLSFIISGHPDWKKTNIKIFEICQPERYEETKKGLSELVRTGRLPITEQNIEIILEKPGLSQKKLINEKSSNAALTMIGLKHSWESTLTCYDELGTVLFVTSSSRDLKII